MRLINILEFNPVPPSPFDETPLVYPQRLPMWVLEAPYEEYKAFKIKRLFEALTITEAAIDRYKQMIEVFKTIDQLSGKINEKSIYQFALDELKWAMNTLRREDRIIWYMRLIKAEMLRRTTFWNKPNSVDQEVWENATTKEYKKAFNKLVKLYNNENMAKAAMEQIGLGRLHSQFEHYLSMGIPLIDQTQWTNQLPYVLINHFGNIEREWAERRQSVIDVSPEEQEEVSKIIEFPDGSAWFNLNRSSCDIEAGAMGHCGNTAAERESETVLSYRVPVDKEGNPRKSDQGGTHWKPRLTFILDTESGFLGEMKGRANSKPKKELHPYIIALLRHPMISGIRGGGYSPENNFSLDDLDSETKDQLIKEKPGLGSLKDIYEYNGRKVTDELIDRIEWMLVEADVMSPETTYSPEQNGWILQKFSNPNDLIQEYGNDTIKRVSELVFGGDMMDWYDPDIDHDSRVDLAETFFKQNPKEWKNLQAYMLKEYPEHFDDEGAHDIENVDDVLEVGRIEQEEWYNQIGFSVSDGLRAGAENEMHEAVINWLKNPFEDAHLSVTFSETGWMDSPVWVVSGIPWLISALSENYIIEDLRDGGWKSILEEHVERFDEPHYGWSGYDEEAALESLHSMLDIPEVPEREIEKEGNATDEDVVKFRTFLRKLDGEHIKGIPGWSWKIDEYNTVISDPREVNGVIAFNAYAWPGGDQTENLKNALHVMTKLADTHSIPIVLRRYNEGTLDPKKLESIGFKQIENDYWRYDPEGVKESTSIRLKTRKGKTDAFIDDLFQVGHPHPFDNRAILLGPVGVEVSGMENEIHIHDIRTYQEHRQGHATEAVEFLKELADKHGVKLSGTAKAYSKSPEHIQDTEKLAQWYRKLGFEITGGNEDDGYDIEYTPKVTEAPIGDYALIGKWGDQEKSHSFRHAQDRKMIQSENLIKKVRKKFGNTEHWLNFYFVNLPGAAKHAEKGLVDGRWLGENMPKTYELILQREQEQGTDWMNAINVLFVGNAGFQRVPMTAWIMAHRLGHAIQSGRTFENRTMGFKIPSWGDLERDFEEFIVQMLFEVYGWKIGKVGSFAISNRNEPSFWFHPDVAKFFEAIGTMNSARRGKLGGRPYEFLYELFAQYITTGSVRFNELPRVFGRKQSKHHSQEEDLREMYSRDLNDWFADHITSRMDNCLYEVTGKYLVM